MLKYLVTGGCGFIGSHLCERLLESGHQVRVLDDLSNGSKKNLPPGIELIEGSITDEKALKKALQNIDGIFHLAARVSVIDSIQHRTQTHEVNCTATIRLFEMARGIPTIFASSAAIYGDNPHLPHKENALPHPLSPYAVDKLACEQHARLNQELYNTPTLTFRFFNIYGPRQNPSSPYSGVIAKFLDRIHNNQPLTIFGNGEQRRDFIYVKDVAHILTQAMSPHIKSGTYNLCTGKDVSINQLADLLSEITHIPIKKEFAPARPGEILISRGDPTHTHRTLGLTAPTSLKEGLTAILTQFNLL